MHVYNIQWYRTNVCKPARNKFSRVYNRPAKNCAAAAGRRLAGAAAACFSNAAYTLRTYLRACRTRYCYSARERGTRFVSITRKSYEPKKKTEKNRKNIVKTCKKCDRNFVLCGHNDSRDNDFISDLRPQHDVCTCG